MYATCRDALYRAASRAFALRHSVKGSVSVELAFFVPVVAAMIAGSVEFGRLGLEQVRVSSAAHAGAQYGSYDLSSAGDIDGMVAAAHDDADDVGNKLDVTAVRICRCADGNEQACNTSCSDGEYAPLYVEVSVSQDVDLWFSFPGIPSTITLAANSSMRLR